MGTKAGLRECLAQSKKGNFRAQNFPSLKICKIFIRKTLLEEKVVIVELGEYIESAPSVLVVI